MSQSPEAFTSEPTGQQFFGDLLSHQMLGVMIPKVQVERSLGPILGMFLPQVLTEVLTERSRVGHQIEMLCPEFPIRKEQLEGRSTNQSTNIDWVMYDKLSGDLILVELKTADTSFSADQIRIYDNLQERVEKYSADFLVKDLLDIYGASQEKGKYLNVFKMLAQVLEIPDYVPQILIDALSQCKRARIVYIAPKVSKPADWPEDDPYRLWLSFGDLPSDLDEDYPYASYWPVLHKELISLDDKTRSIRNAAARLNQAGTYYAGTKNYDRIKELCTDKGATVVIGWKDWQKIYPDITSEAFRKLSFKWDDAGEIRGNKNPRNWIRGNVFLEMMQRKTPD